MTVYVDVLIATNMFVNCLLLSGTKRVLHCELKTSRLLAASFAGALYSLIIFADGLPVYIKIPLNIAALSLITVIAFRPKKIKSFLKYASAFLLVNFIFAGLMLALWIFVKPDGMVFDEENEVIIHYYERILDTDKPEIIKSSVPASGSLVNEGNTITYNIAVKNPR